MIELAPDAALFWLQLHTENKQTLTNDNVLRILDIVDRVWHGFRNNVLAAYSHPSSDQRLAVQHIHENPEKLHQVIKFEFSKRFSALGTHTQNGLDGKVWELANRPDVPNFGNTHRFTDWSRFFKAYQAVAPPSTRTSVSSQMPMHPPHSQSSTHATTFAQIAGSNPTGHLTFYLDGETAFLGNFQPCRIQYDNRTFKCAEAAFQSRKFDGNPNIKNQFQSVDGEGAFRLAQQYRSFVIQSTWRDNRRNETVMQEVLEAKFTQNPDLAQKLEATGSLHLREETTKSGRDVFWATDPNPQSVHHINGRNMLGEMLIGVRTKIRQGQLQVSPIQPTLIPSLPSNGNTCQNPGCDKPKFMERDPFSAAMKKYPYCGKTCASKAKSTSNSNQHSSSRPKQCVNSGCSKPQYIEKYSDGSVKKQHPFCGKSCAIKAKYTSSYNQHLSSNGNTCQNPGCNKPKFIERSPFSAAIKKNTHFVAKPVQAKLKQTDLIKEKSIQ